VHRIHPSHRLGGAPGWGPAGWGPAGWSPLVDDGPLALRTAGQLGRWWWPTLAVAGFLTVVAYVLGHEDPAAPGLSTRGLLTIALAATVLVLLTARRAAGPGPLARAVAEYTLVALLAGLLATTGHTDPAGQGGHATPAGKADPAPNATAGGDPPAVLQAVTKALRAGAAVIRAVTGEAGWLAELWHRADQQTDRHHPPPSTTAAKAAVLPRSPALPSSTRRPT
jgi:hypothetical protein